jgi:hypothetical protein
VTKFRHASEQAITEHDKDLRGPYGWAAPLFEPGRRLQFPDLEDLAGLRHTRSFYEWANHNVHATAPALNLGAEPLGDLVEVGYSAWEARQTAPPAERRRASVFASFEPPRAENSSTATNSLTAVPGSRQMRLYVETAPSGAPTSRGTVLASTSHRPRHAR